VRILLDTHVFIWWDNDYKLLPSPVLQHFLDPANSLYLSLVSIWEMQIKVQLGKLKLRLPLATIIQQQLANGIQIQPITLEDILAVSELPYLHNDPFDRLIISQARRNNFQLATQDHKVSQYDVPIFWA
jgi:PIN domain nuclease of toxin-antitoxin system